MKLSEIRFVAVMLAAIMLVSAAQAAVQPAELFGDNMVLQRSKPVPVFGTAEAGEGFTVSISNVCTPARHEVRAPGLKLTLSADGRIVSLIAGDKGIERAVAGETLLEGCRTQGEVAAKTLLHGGMEFTRTLVADNPAHTCQVIERFMPTRDSVRWEIEIRGKGDPWSTEILTQLAYPAIPQTRFWIAGSGDGSWTDPLTVMPLKDAAFDYGAPSFRLDNPRLAFCPGWESGNIICLPLFSVMEPETDTGLSIVLSPEDISREIMMRMTKSGRFTFARARHRIDARRPLTFAMDIVSHEAGWRGSLRWITTRYPHFFDPVNPLAHAMGGTAAYSCKDVDFDAEKMRRMAFRVNWRASFDFPYMGMFIPPVADTESWSRFGGGKTSLPALREYAAKMRQLGFYVLSYFNVTEFGAHVTWPLPEREMERDKNLWKNCNDFLGAKLSSAILRIPDGITSNVLAKSTYPRSRPGGCYFTWEDGIVLDCADPAYRDFLLEQARRHIEKIPQSSGICIDRLDWLRLYNDRADDGESWFEGKPARSLMASWNDLMDQLGPLMHQAGKVVFVNNHSKRLDLLRHTDGIYDEFTYKAAALNLTALLTLRKPALGWTDNEGALKPDPDAFFQRYLHLGVYPMAPFPGNDHSLRPSAWVDQQYLDYGPLLDAMRGKKWVLEPYCVEASDQAARVNLFEVPSGYALPVTFGDTNQVVKIKVRNVKGLKTAKSVALYPGTEKSEELVTVYKDGVLELAVPLRRRCAMVRLLKESQ